MKNMKGISLSMETVVLLILMVIVLAALLGFFTGIFNPAQTKIDMLRNKESLCLKYVSVDPGCGHAKEIIEQKDSYKTGKYSEAYTAAYSIANNVCNKPTGDAVCGTGIDNPTGKPYECLLSCCSIQCGR
ncbi:MAG: hypothetical protein V1870_00345 [Candidatus Aenigmatarchaeota archaeon]